MASSSQPVMENPEDIEEEKRLEDAMEHLKILHLKMRRLRSAVHRAVQPLTTKQPSPEALFASFTKSVGETSNELNEFKTLITSKESKEVFQRAADSRQANPKGIRPWRATQDPEWTTLRK